MEVQEIEGLGWRLKRFLGQFDSCIYSKKGRVHLETYVKGQLGPLKRKSVEPIADAAGVPPRRLQEFLSLLRWEEDGVRDRIQAIVKRKHDGEENIGILDETGFPKKGKHTAGVQRQYCGQSGKVENCVVTINLILAVDTFHTGLDSELYLPKSWHEDRERCRAAGIPDEVVYRPVHEIALGQIQRARANGVRLDWVTADERYGEVPQLLSSLEGMGQPSVFEIPPNVTGWTVKPKVWQDSSEAGPAGKRLRKFPRLASSARRARPVKELAAHSRSLRKQPWVAFRIKETFKGPEVWEAKACTFYQKREGLPSRPLQLIVARNVVSGITKYFLAYNPNEAPLEVLLRVAFTRWHVERCFEDSKGELGMGHFEVRNYRSMTRHFTLSMVSHLFLAEQRDRLAEKKTSRI